MENGLGQYREQCCQSRIYMTSPGALGEGPHAGGGRMLGTAAATHKAEPGTGSSGGNLVPGGEGRSRSGLVWSGRFWDDGGERGGTEGLGGGGWVAPAARAPSGTACKLK